MTYSRITLLTSCLALIGLSACSGGAPKMEEAKYWQRNTASSALYLQGPKAQQTLHQDIATCVNEIKELNRLGEIRRTIPANYNSGNTIEKNSASKKELAQYDTPARDGFLYNEHTNYHDFEFCMDGKGWERVAYLPYDRADLARKEYLQQYGPKKKKQFGKRENVTTIEPSLSK